MTLAKKSRGRTEGLAQVRLIGRNLRRLREAAELSQRALSLLTRGVASQSDISRIEDGLTKDPSAIKLKTIADVLGVGIEEFWRIG